MERGARIWIAGGGPFLGGALERCLRAAGHEALLGAGGAAPDLRDAAAVDAFFAKEKPEWVFLLGGRSGGIARNQREPAELMLDNLRVETAVLPAAQRHGVRKLLYLAAACIYPRECEQPMRPEQLGSGPLEPTSEAYAMAKWSGLVLASAYARQHRAPFFGAIPANAFGPGAETGAEDAHVVEALLCRMHAARQQGHAEVVVWGSGRAVRDWLYVDDLADACVFLMERYTGEQPINVSGGAPSSVAELAERVRAVVGFEGRLRFDASRPDGAPRKVLDGEPLRRLGWAPRVSLDEALARTYAWVREQAHGAQPHG
jgi:GDP-L-fucose synthase